MDSTSKKRLASIELRVVGDSSVGKTSMYLRHATNKYPTEFDLKTSKAFHYVPTIDLEQCTLQIQVLVCNGSDEYSRLRPLSYPRTDVFVFCFSVDNRRSFENIKTHWKPEIEEHCPDVAAVLVGCRTDLRNHQETIEKLKENGDSFISPEEGRQMAAEIGAARYLECSALTGEGTVQLLKVPGEVALNHNIKIKKNKNCKIL